MASKLTELTELTEQSMHGRAEYVRARRGSYHFVALSRTSRDLIALLIRCFHSRLTSAD